MKNQGFLKSKYSDKRVGLTKKTTKYTCCNFVLTKLFSYIGLQETWIILFFVHDDHITISLSCKICFCNCLARLPFSKIVKLSINFIASSNTFLLGYLFSADFICSLPSSIISTSFLLVFSMMNWCSSSSLLGKNWMELPFPYIWQWRSQQ